MTNYIGQTLVVAYDQVQTNIRWNSSILLCRLFPARCNLWMFCTKTDLQFLPQAFDEINFLWLQRPFQNGMAFDLYIQPFITTLALSQVGRCWNHHIRPSPSFRASFFKFSSKISLQFSFLKIPSIRWSVPATYVEKQPHNVIDPQSCSTVVCRTAGLSLFFI